MKLLYSATVQGGDQPSRKLPLYFFTGSQPYAELFQLAQAAGIDWRHLCDVVEIPDDEATFFWWLREYLIEQAQL